MPKTSLYNLYKTKAKQLDALVAILESPHVHADYVMLSRDKRLQVRKTLDNVATITIETS